MGDIIKVDFGGGNVSEKKNPKPQNPPEVEFSDEVLPFIPKPTGEKGGMASFEQVRDNLKSLNDFLRGVPLSGSETAALRQGLVSSMTFLEICNTIADSSEREWQLRPAYFRALADEFWLKLSSKKPTSGPKNFSETPNGPKKPKGE